MNSQPKHNSDPHDDALDLQGLEGLLEGNHTESLEEVSENQTIIRLMNQICLVTELLNDTSERLERADEKLRSLANLVSHQNKQMEQLAHFQVEAARATKLDEEIAQCKSEIERLQKPWYRKLFA